MKHWKKFGPPEFPRRRTVKNLRYGDNARRLKVFEVWMEKHAFPTSIGSSISTILLDRSRIHAKCSRRKKLRGRDRRRRQDVVDLFYWKQSQAWYHSIGQEMPDNFD